MSHKQQAEQEAIRLALGKLVSLGDWPVRCSRLGLPNLSTTGGSIRIAILGTELDIRLPDFQAEVMRTARRPAPVEYLLALHYLMGEVSLTPMREWITFREFPGGQFYWEPFLSRSIKPLIARIGNNQDLLRDRLSRCSAAVETLPEGGLQATIRALGVIDLMLVYRSGDDEFPPAAEVLYDACARRSLCAEDAAALAGRLCVGLVRETG